MQENVNQGEDLKGKRKNMNQRPRGSSGQRIKGKSLLNSQHEEGNMCTVGKQEHITLGTVHFFFFFLNHLYTENRNNSYTVLTFVGYLNC